MSSEDSWGLRNPDVNWKPLLPSPGAAVQAMCPQDTPPRRTHPPRGHTCPQDTPPRGHIAQEDTPAQSTHPPRAHTAHCTQPPSSAGTCQQARPSPPSDMGTAGARASTPGRNQGSGLGHSSICAGDQPVAPNTTKHSDRRYRHPLASPVYDTLFTKIGRRVRVTGPELFPGGAILCHVLGGFS